MTRSAVQTAWRKSFTNDVLTLRKFRRDAYVTMRFRFDLDAFASLSFHQICRANAEDVGPCKTSAPMPAFCSRLEVIIKPTFRVSRIVASLSLQLVFLESFCEGRDRKSSSARRRPAAQLYHLITPFHSDIFENSFPNFFRLKDSSR